MSEITREEILALIDVNIKTAGELKNIATALGTIVTNQEKILNRVNNEIVREVAAQAEKQCAGCKVLVEKTRDDTFWIKIIFGSIAFITAISAAIMTISHHIATVGGK